MKKYLFAVVLLFLAGAPGTFFAADIKDMKGKGPIEITSDRLDAYDEQKLVVFSGNVVAVQDDKTIYCKTMNIYYKKDPPPKAQRKTEAGTSDLDRIEAEGNVKVVQLNRTVTGEKAVYLQDDQKIIVTGNPVLTEGENVIRGERVIVLLDQNKGIVESSPKQRVKAFIKTTDKQPEKKAPDKKGAELKPAEGKGADSKEAASKTLEKGAQK